MENQKHAVEVLVLFVLGMTVWDRIDILVPAQVLDRRQPRVLIHGVASDKNVMGLPFGRRDGFRLGTGHYGEQLAGAGGGAVLLR